MTDPSTHTDETKPVAAPSAGVGNKVGYVLTFGIYLLLFIVQLFATYHGFSWLLDEKFGRLCVIAAVLVTVMFQLDIVMAPIGFLGFWKVWDLPLLESLAISALFLVVALFVKFGPWSKMSRKDGPLSLFWKNKKKTSTSATADK